MPDPLAEIKNPNYSSPQTLVGLHPGLPKEPALNPVFQNRNTPRGTELLRPDCPSQSAGSFKHMLGFNSQAFRLARHLVPMTSLASGVIMVQTVSPTSGKCFGNIPPAVSLWRSKLWLTSPSQSGHPCRHIPEASQMGIPADTFPKLLSLGISATTMILVSQANSWQRETQGSP